MNEILERIAKSLESIDAELKARNKDREILINQAEQIEKTCLEIKEDPFGLNVLKEKALADKAKQSDCACCENQIQKGTNNERNF